MITRRLSPWVPLLLLAAAGLVGCEPYMSMTDRIPAHTRQATALLPEAPRYAGMVDLETVLGQVEEFGNATTADSLRNIDSERLRAFLDATGMNPRTDLKAVYGAIGGEETFSAVLFADLTPAQMDRYLDRVPDGAGHATTYRDVPLYHLHTGLEKEDAQEAPDTLSLAFVRSGMIAAATDGGAVKAMVDRHRADANSFRDNRPYMTLVERVGHGSTAWLVGRDVLQTALRDSAGGRAATGGFRMNEAGVQQLLSGWADRVLGLSDAPPIAEAASGSKVKQLKGKIREQAISVTLTDETLDGEAYLTMRDETSAANVVDLSKGAMAALRLSDQGDGDGPSRFLDDLTVERDGPVVHVQFSTAREQLRDSMGEARAARRAKASARRLNVTVHRSTGITHRRPALGPSHTLTRACNLCANRPVPFATRQAGG